MTKKQRINLWRRVANCFHPNEMNEIKQNKQKQDLQRQKQVLLDQEQEIKNQEKRIAQMIGGEAPLFKDICPSCGGEGCNCARWNWYGEADGLNHNEKNL